MRAMAESAIITVFTFQSSFSIGNLFNNELASRVTNLEELLRHDRRKERRTRLNSPSIAGPLSSHKNVKCRADDIDHGL